MLKPTRRSVIQGSLGMIASGGVARPYIANAAATTATVWWVQGFAEEEDISFKKLVADYEKSSGNKLDYSIIPYAPERQKIVSAMTTGAGVAGTDHCGLLGVQSGLRPGAKRTRLPDRLGGNRQGTALPQRRQPKRR